MPEPRKAKRRIKKARITFVSLCKAGRNLLDTVYKSEDECELQTLVAKADMEQGLLTTLVYVPDHPDSDADVASAEVIKEMCHSHAAEGLQIDTNHDQSPIGKDRAFVAESFIVQKGDPRFRGLKDKLGNDVDATGGWGQVIKILDPTIRAGYRDGDWNGVSMFGPASFEKITKAQETTMTEAERKALTEQIVKAMQEQGLSGDKLQNAVDTAVEKALAAKAPVEPEAVEFVAPKFEGDVTAQALRDHGTAVQKAKIVFDLAQPGADFEQLAKALEALEGDEGDEGDDGEAPKGQSNQPKGKVQKSEDVSKAVLARQREDKRVENSIRSQYPNATDAEVANHLRRTRIVIVNS